MMIVVASHKSGGATTTAAALAAVVAGRARGAGGGRPGRRGHQRLAPRPGHPGLVTLASACRAGAVSNFPRTRCALPCGSGGGRWHRRAARRRRRRSRCWPTPTPACGPRTRPVVVDVGRLEPGSPALAACRRRRCAARVPASMCSRCCGLSLAELAFPSAALVSDRPGPFTTPMSWTPSCRCLSPAQLPLDRHAAEVIAGTRRPASGWLRVGLPAAARTLATPLPHSHARDVTPDDHHRGRAQRAAAGRRPTHPGRRRPGQPRRRWAAAPSTERRELAERYTGRGPRRPCPADPGRGTVAAVGCRRSPHRPRGHRSPDRSRGLQQLLDDPMVENIDANGCDRVFVRYTDGRVEQADPIADSDEAMIELIRTLASEAAFGDDTAGLGEERAFDRHNQQLDLRLRDGARLCAVMSVSGGRPVDPPTHAATRAAAKTWSAAAPSTSRCARCCRRRCAPSST